MRKHLHHALLFFLCMAMVLGMAGCGEKTNSAQVQESAETAEESYGNEAEESVLGYEAIAGSQPNLYFVGMTFASDGEGNTLDVWMIPDQNGTVVGAGKNEAHTSGFFAEDYWGHSLEDAFVMAYDNLTGSGDIPEQQEKLICRITAMSYDREDELKEILQNACQRIAPSAEIEYCVDSEVERIAGCFNLDDMYIYHQENPGTNSNNPEVDILSEDFKTMTLSENTTLDAGMIDLSTPLIVDVNGYSLKMTGMLLFDSAQCRKYDGVLERNLGDGRYCGIFRVEDSSPDKSGVLDVSELHFGMADQDQIDAEDADIDFHNCVALFEIGYKNVAGLAKGSEHNETDPYFDLHVDGSGEFMNLIYFHEGYDTRTQYWNENIYEAMNNNINVEDYHESLCMHDADVELDFDKLNLDCESAAFGGPMDYFIYVGKGTTLKLTGTYDYRNVSLKIIYLDRFGDGPVTIDAKDLKFILHDEYKQPEIIKVDNWYSDSVQANVTFIYPSVTTNTSESNLIFEDGKIAILLDVT